MPDAPNPLKIWLGNRFPDILAAYEAENEKLDALAALERTIAEATEEARRIRAELGMTPPYVDAVTDPEPEPAPAPKKRAAKKPAPKPAPAPEPEPEEEPFPESGDKFSGGEPATDEDDFEDFEVPGDDEDDEF